MLLGGGQDECVAGREKVRSNNRWSTSLFPDRLRDNFAFMVGCSYVLYFVQGGKVRGFRSVLIFCNSIRAYLTYLTITGLDSIFTFLWVILHHRKSNFLGTVHSKAGEFVYWFTLSCVR